MSVESRSRSEWAASAKRPRLPDNRPTRSLSAAKLPLATIETVVTACLDWAPGSFPTSLFEYQGRRIPSSLSDLSPNLCAVGSQESQETPCRPKSSAHSELRQLLTFLNLLD